MIRLLILVIIKFILGAESGASFSWSSKWQDKKPWFSELPEAIDALLLAYMATSLIWMSIFPLDHVLTIGYDAYHLGVSVGVLAFAASFFVAYAGIQAATWMFLKWDQGAHDGFAQGRGATVKPLVDIIADKLGFIEGTEGYSWTAATVKGSIICFPAGLIFAPIGGFFFAAGYEIGSWFKRKGRAKYLPRFLTPHAISEGMSFVGVGLFYTLCVFVVDLVRGFYGLG